MNSASDSTAAKDPGSPPHCNRINDGILQQTFQKSVNYFAILSSILVNCDSTRDQTTEGTPKANVYYSPFAATGEHMSGKITRLWSSYRQASGTENIFIPQFFDRMGEVCPPLVSLALNCCGWVHFTSNIYLGFDGEVTRSTRKNPLKNLQKVELWPNGR